MDDYVYSACMKYSYMCKWVYLLFRVWILADKIQFQVYMTFTWPIAWIICFWSNPDPFQISHIEVSFSATALFLYWFFSSISSLIRLLLSALLLYRTLHSYNLIWAVCHLFPQRWQTLNVQSRGNHWPGGPRDMLATTSARKFKSCVLSHL